MATELEWFVEGAGVCEKGEEEWYGNGVCVNENTPAVAEEGPPDNSLMLMGVGV